MTLPEIKIAEAKLRIAVITRDYLKSDLDRLELLWESEACSEREIMDLRRNTAIAEQKVLIAQARLELAKGEVS